MDSEFSPELRRELLDDFYAECDELIGGVRTQLTKLEEVAAQEKSAPELIEAIFRSIHSLKGGSAIVGLRSAEELAHRMEDLVRGWSKHEIAVSIPAIDLLLAATQRLEQVVIAQRLNSAVPDTTDLLNELARSKASASAPTALRSEAAEPAAAPVEDPIERAWERGLKPWLFSFAPSPELDRRGINLQSVRERLMRCGEILSATPVVRAQGRMIFEFVVGLREAPTNESEGEADGLTGRPISPKPPANRREPASASPVSELPDALSLTPSHMVRVDLGRLDELLRITGEMVIYRSRLDDYVGQRASNDSRLREINLALGRSLRAMRESVARVRMVSVGEIFTRMPFVVRDLVRESGKQARIALEGHQTEIDKYLVERLKEPLLHLVRNAFAHGVETPAERRAAGKPAAAVILLRAMTAGNSVVIQVRDDGRGIDAAAIARRAAALQLPVTEPWDEAAVLQVLCEPGFSTRESADLAAGRGVGMSVVADTVRELGGTLTLETWPDAGTQFTLKLPLTLAIADAIIVAAGDQACAVPQSAIDSIFQAPTADAVAINETETIPFQGGLLPFVRLRTVFGLAASPSPTLTLLVVSSDRGLTGIAVDRVHSQREIVIRQLADPLLQVPGISGATELGDGRPILILDPISITRGAARPPASAVRRA